MGSHHERQMNVSKETFVVEVPNLPQAKESVSIPVGDAWVTLYGESSGGVYIDRIFVEPDKRLQGNASKAIEALVNWSKKEGIALSAIVSPDDDNAHSGLVEAFLQAGFKSLEMDGEVYYDNVVYDPHRP